MLYRAGGAWEHAYINTIGCHLRRLRKDSKHSARSIHIGCSMRIDTSVSIALLLLMLLHLLDLVD